MDSISGVTNEIAPGLFFNRIGSLFAETKTSSNLIVFKESDIPVWLYMILLVNAARAIMDNFLFIFQFINKLC
jgi:hypothetical protein